MTNKRRGSAVHKQLISFERKRRSFDCESHDRAVRFFAQDDNLLDGYEEDDVL